MIYLIFWIYKERKICFCGTLEGVAQRWPGWKHYTGLASSFPRGWGGLGSHGGPENLSAGFSQHSIVYWDGSHDAERRYYSFSDRRCIFFVVGTARASPAQNNGMIIYAYIYILYINIYTYILYLCMIVYGCLCCVFSSV